MTCAVQAPPEPPYQLLHLFTITKWLLVLIYAHCLRRALRSSASIHANAKIQR